MPSSGTVTARPSSFRKLLALTLISAAGAGVLGLGACKAEKSELERLGERKSAEPAADPVQIGGPAKPDDAGPAKSDPSTGAPDYALDRDGLPVPPLEGAAPLLTAGAEAERVELRLALVDGARYRTTTLGMLKLPLFEGPIGFAREEELRLGDCVGEAAGRSCLLSHSYRDFEAEPPTGEALEKDEALVAKFETAHRIDASGLRITETAINNGTPETPAAEALTQVHRLHCLRFPSEPVGVGATWRDVCRTRLGGAVITRELVWRLAKLEQSEDGARAELEYAGRVRRVDGDKGLRNGEVQGTLLFWVDAGEPHLIRERVTFVIDAERGISTGTDLRYSFAKLGEGEELIRTDGKAFEQPPTALNDLRAVPNGATRDAEHPKDAKPAKGQIN